MPRSKTNLKPLRKRGLLAEAVESIQRAILEGDMAKGDLLPAEGELANRLGISRTIIREAMRVLEARGLVDIGQGRRARARGGDPSAVAAPLHILISRSDHALLDLIEVRRGIEGEMAALAARRRTSEHTQALEAVIQQMKDAGGDLDKLIEADLRFHDLLAECTGNPVFTAMLAPLADLMRASRQRTLKSAGPELAVRCHQAILEAVLRHDEPAARQAMLDHLDLAQIQFTKPERERE